MNIVNNSTFIGESNLTNRYGTNTKKMSPKTKWAFLVVIMLVSLSWMVWSVTFSANQKVSYKNVGYQIVDETQATVEFQITKDPQQTAQCVLQILSENFSIVGWKQIVIPPNDKTNTLHSELVRTEHLGVSGLVHSCWVA